MYSQEALQGTAISGTTTLRDSGVGSEMYRNNGCDQGASAFREEFGMDIEVIEPETGVPVKKKGRR